MFNDKSGQLMLIGSFMLAMVVVTISLLLNNVIYSSNLAYDGFMDQSRYDDLGYRQVTAYEMNYAYDYYFNDHIPAYPDSSDGKYEKYLTDYEGALNKITNVKGRYVDLASPGGVPDPNAGQLAPAGVDQMKLSIYGKSSSASYGITIGSFAPTYIITLTSDKDPIIGGVGSTDKATITVEVKKTDGTPQQVPIKLNSRSTGVFTPLGGNPGPSADGWWQITAADGKLQVYYLDTGMGGSTTVSASTQNGNSGQLQISVTGPAVYNILLTPTTSSAPYPAIICNNYDRIAINAHVVDAVTGLSVPNALVKFTSDRAVYNFLMSDGVTDAGAGVSTDGNGNVMVYYTDSVNAVPGVAHITAEVNRLNSITNPVNPVSIECLPSSLATVDTASTKTFIDNAPAPYPNTDKLITVTFIINPQLNLIAPPIAGSFINIDSVTLISANKISLDNANPPTYTNVGGVSKLLIPVNGFQGNQQFTLKLQIAFNGYDPNGVKYHKTGTLTIIGDKNILSSTTLTFP